jgi:hypothetical protein
LFCPNEDIKRGVYAGNLKENVLWTRDDEGNKFTLSSDIDPDCYIAVSLDIGRKEGERPDSPRFKGDSYVKKENLFLP